MVGGMRAMFILVGILAILTACSRREKHGTAAFAMNRAETVLTALGPELALLATNGTATNIQQLAAAFERKFSKPPFAMRLSPPSVWTNHYELAPGEYFWITDWSGQDSVSAPLFWGRFRVPNEVVVYT